MSGEAEKIKGISHPKAAVSENGAQFRSLDPPVNHSPSAGAAPTTAAPAWRKVALQEGVRRISVCSPLRVRLTESISITARNSPTQ